MSQPAGIGTPLPQKLGIGEDDAVALIGAPEWLEDLLGEVPSVAQVHTDLDGDALFDVIVVFVSWRAELEAELGRLRDRMAPACALWVAWPKKASEVPTDMSDNVVREVAPAHRPRRQQGLRDRRDLVGAAPGDQAGNR